jgi:hypothetical protein
MNARKTFILWLYSALIRFYPTAFRTAFFTDMQAAFEDALEDAFCSGGKEPLRLIIQEFYDLPCSLFREHLASIQTMQEAEMEKAFPKASWTETLLAVLPTVVWVFGIVAFNAIRIAGGSRIFGTAVLILLILFVLAGVYLVIRSLKLGFPRWSYAYISWLIALILVMPAFRISSSMMVPIIAPLMIVAAIVVLLSVTHSWTRVSRLIQNVREDWTLISFAFFSLLPFLVILPGEMVDDQFFFPFALAGLLILAAGGMGYMRSQKTWQRFFALLVSAICALSIPNVASNIYWQGINSDYLSPLLPMALMLSAVMLLPGIVRWISLLFRRTNKTI